MSNTSPNTAPRWEVVSQRTTIGRLPDDTMGSVVQVRYRTADGVVAWVEIPTTRFTPDAVRAAIEAQVTHVQAVSDLKG